MRASYWAALCGIVVVAGACEDTGLGPDEGGEGSTTLRPPAAVNRFDVQLRASGSFRPGDPVQITVTGRANLRTQDVQVRLVLPEVAAAREAGWNGLHLPVGEPLAPEISERSAMSRGQSLARTANVVIPRPGYYQVVASVLRASAQSVDERTPNGELDQDVAHAELWLWISESGGKVTPRFDPSLFPAGTWAIPGPLTPSTESRPGATGEAAAGVRGARVPGGPRGSHTGSAGYVQSHAVYLNNDKGTTAPIPNARAEYTIYTRAGATVRIDRLNTDATGNSYTTCYSDAGGYGTYRYRVLLDNDRVGMESPVVIDLSGDFAADCGKVFTDQVPSTQTYGKERAHVFVGLDQGIRNADRFFAFSRPRILVRLDPALPYSTYDWNGSDMLMIDTQPDGVYKDQIWGTYGAFVQMHEYGHAFHETVLGGVKRYYSCPEPHYMETITTLGCALAEGFPDYFAVVTRGSAMGIMESDIERGVYSPGTTSEYNVAAGTNGGRIEGAVASFLYDITDPANETHDLTAYPGRYVADIIRTCQVYVSGVWQLNSGVDHLVYCFQGTIDSDASKFGRTVATSFNYSATDPEAYSTRYGKIRKSYRKNLFGHDN
jgi:hypothetical protein